MQGGLMVPGNADPAAGRLQSDPEFAASDGQIEFSGPVSTSVAFASGFY